MAIPQTNPDGSVTLRSATSGPLVTVAGTGQVPSKGGELLATAYWVDPVAGNDNNDGLSLASAVRTYRLGLSRIFDRQVAPPASSVVVNQTGSVASDDVFWGRAALNNATFQVYLRATGTTILSGPHTITARTTGSPTTRASFTCAGVDFSAFVGKRVRVVSGAGTNSVGFIQVVNPVDTCFLPSPINLTSGSATGQWTVGTSIVVEDVWTAPQIEPAAVSPTQSLGAWGFESLSFANRTTLSLANAVFWACDLGLTSGFLDFSGYSFALASRISAPSGFFQTGFFQFENCSCALTQVICQRIEFSRSVQSGVGMVVTAGVLNGRNYLQSFEVPANTPALELRNGANARMTAVWFGTSTAAGSYGIKTDPGSVYAYGTSSKPTVAGAAAFAVDCAGTQVAYGAVPVVVAARLSAVCDGLP